MTETKRDVAEVPTSAPMMAATANDSGMAPPETKATIVESKAPLLWRRVVAIHPVKTLLVVSFIRSMIFSARDSPMHTAEHLMSTIEDTKKQMLRSETTKFL